VRSKSVQSDDFALSRFISSQSSSLHSLGSSRTSTSSRGSASSQSQSQTLCGKQTELPLEEVKCQQAAVREYAAAMRHHHIKQCYNSLKSQEEPPRQPSPVRPSNTPQPLPTHQLLPTNQPLPIHQPLPTDQPSTSLQPLPTHQPLPSLQPLPTHTPASIHQSPASQKRCVGGKIGWRREEEEEEEEAEFNRQLVAVREEEARKGLQSGALDMWASAA
jgi:hypothetical protein